LRPDLVQRYLHRIGASAPLRPSYQALAELTARHLEAVPFENLSCHLGETVSLDEEALLGKIIEHRRGGICYELNGAFALLLRALGFDVDLLAARIHHDDGRDGLPFGHLALRVHGSAPALVDVGFGTETVALVPWEVLSANGLHIADYGDVRVHVVGRHIYTVETRPRRLADFTAMLWWMYNSPHSRFTQSLVCTRVVPGGRRTLSGRRLIDVSALGREERTLPLDRVLDCYRDEFGIRLTRMPATSPGRTR
jgi:N-hydroxyarylamine O-acetyltransferase